MIIQTHRLQSEDIKHYNCPKNKKPLQELKYIIIHYTASSNMNTTINYLLQKEIDASAHLVIGRKGEIAQLVPFNIQAWHAGKSSYHGHQHLNRYSIGIELMNLGKLKHISNSYYDCNDNLVSPDDIHSTTNQKGITTHWQRYTPEQLTTVQQICETLLNQYPQIQDILGHSDITTRKLDPGPAFPIEKFKLLL